MSAAELALRGARVVGHDGPVDILVSGGRIASLARPGEAAEAAREIAAGGRLVIPGFVDSHIHLDKACLNGRCGHLQGGPGGLKAAIAAVSALKRDFTVEDVHRRGARVIEKAIARGTTHMRTHVEVDPRVGLRSFEAIRALRRDYAWALDLSICVFPQEGLTNDPGTAELLEAALAGGADLLGGCPYTDTDPAAHVAALFDLARRHDVDLDFHVDFDLDPGWNHLELILRHTEAAGYGGRVAVGHATKLSAMDPAVRDALADRMAGAGVALTVLPATDLYLMGREADRRVPRGLAPLHLLAARGVTGSIATNNVLNPFTPFGDGSLLRMANLYANAAQVDPGAFPLCLDLVTRQPARLMRLAGYGIAPGNPADLVVLDAAGPAEAVAEIAEPILGFKAGRASFERPAARLLPP
ncbi:amidohydrolase family protein [Ancylobacter lacus]|uniref:amidohydrolase family protein n=1 Tax=Ancylobacter lacus TaxID=2579970 RepID=UPI001BD0962C|nr:amidohydrolase family protein [Ancylobacter lacus]MBS7539584.1 amidohydrolase family protein [Ancylobacter lacus]